MNRLAKAELALFVLLGLHTIDHAINQPARELPAGSGLVGILGFAIVAVAILAALAHSRWESEIGLLSRELRDSARARAAAA